MDGKRLRLYDAVGRALHQRRNGAGLSVATFAKTLGISADYLSKIEGGETACPLHVLVDIAHELDVSLDSLVPVLTDEGAA